MIWSYSSAKVFQQCQRRWYFKNCLANARAKDLLRREAYLLSKLQSLSAWRGQIVDDIMTEIVIALNRNASVTQKEVTRRARQLFDTQLTFAMAHRVRDRSITPTKAGDAFAAFYDIEYGQRPNEMQIE